MRKDLPLTKAALNRALAEIHPDRETALELLRLGIYRIRRDGRLHNGKCEAHARTTGKPCQAPAMENGRCKLHGGRSVGIRTELGRARWREGVHRYWARWREERGLGPLSWREKQAAARELRRNSAPQRPPELR
jgi:hypothetical protein